MKSWQYGYDIEYLKSIETYYDRYNSYAFSPFAKYKKNDIAKDLHEGNLKIQANNISNITASAVVQTVKATSDIFLYQNIKIGRKLPKDVVVTRLEGISNEAIAELLLTTNNQNTWIYVWAEDIKLCQLLESLSFEYVGPKVTSFSEIYAIYFKNSSLSFEPRTHPKIDPIEWVASEKIGNINKWWIFDIVSQLNKLTLAFIIHYSNYNSKRSWSALSLRGYYNDQSFIEKPSEMNDKWKQENKDKTFFLQDTTLYDKFACIKTYLPYLFGGQFHRIRFMKLEPGGGELKRHTDLVDIDSGLEIGKLARIHIPIITNDDVEFTVWDLRGNEKTFNMKVGEMWVLDTRKPHRVINKGSTERIHLVIDTIVDQQLYNEILKDFI